MRKVVVSEFVSADDVFEDPGGVEGFQYGGWSFQFKRGPEGDKFKFDELVASDMLLLGRVTYEGFANAWPSIKDKEGYADMMNGRPKYVVSTTLQKAEWNNSHIIKGNLAQEVSKLKQQGDGDIMIYGSGKLVRSLMEDDLVDEFRLMVYPVVLGSGKRLFDGAPKHELELAGTQQLGSGIIVLTYRPPSHRSKK